MPFTLAHPAAVLPLLRRPLHGLALICGAMAPDLPYYIRSTPLQVTAQSWYEPFTNATTSHSLAGLLPVALPLGFMLFVVACAVIPPLVWFAGGRWEVGSMRHVGATSVLDGAGWGQRAARGTWVAVSLLVGALTHLAWDAFTSSDGPLAERVDALNGNVIADLTWVRALQHLSSVVGLTIVVVAFWRRGHLLSSHDASARRRARSGSFAVAAIGLVAATASVLATVDASASASTRDLVEHVVSTGLVGGGVALASVLLVATAVWWSVVLRSSPTSKKRATG